MKKGLRINMLVTTVIIFNLVLAGCTRITIKIQKESEVASNKIGVIGIDMCID